MSLFGFDLGVGENFDPAADLASHTLLRVVAGVIVGLLAATLACRLLFWFARPPESTR